MLTNELEPSSRSCNRGNSRKNRVYKFHEFLLKKYSDILLPACSNDCDKNNEEQQALVLDVAGGKGTLSWLLKNCDGIDSIVVDPRTSNFASLIRSIEYLRSNPEQVVERSNESLPDTFQPLAKLIHLGRFPDAGNEIIPHHLKILVDEPLVDAIANFLQNQNYKQWREFFDSACTKAEHSVPIKERRDLRNGDMKMSSYPIQNADEVLNKILGAKLIVGFHPDQATEASVDLALLLGKPFCLVPCCVFPSEFPHRYLPDGQHVKKYSQFIRYLEHKVPTIRTEYLDFRSTTAKNTILYTLESDFICSSIEASK